MNKKEEQLEDENSKLESKVYDLEEEKKELESKVDYLEYEKQDLEGSVALLEDEVAGLRDRNERLEIVNGRLSQELSGQYETEIHDEEESQRMLDKLVK